MTEYTASAAAPVVLELLWNPNDPRASEAAFREQLAAAESDPARLAELLLWLARTETVQGKIEDARASLARVEHMLPDPKIAAHLAIKVGWLLETGRLCIREKTPSQARPRLVEAWTLAIPGGEHCLAVEVALMMADIEPQKLQTEWLTRAIQLTEESKVPNVKRLQGTIYSALGWKRFDLRLYDAAAADLQKSLACFENEGTRREVFVARWSIGKLLRVIGRTEEALAIQNTLLAELGVGGAKDGRLYHELAECLHTLKRTAEAQVYFELAYRELVADAWFADNEAPVLRRLKELGKAKG